MAAGDELITLVSQLTSSLRTDGGLSAFTWSWVMHIWVVKGAPGIGIPRAFIIAIASGGICGMPFISMVEVTVHRPALPCAAKAMLGARINALPIRAQIRERLMRLSFSTTWLSGTKCGEGRGRRQFKAAVR